MTKRMRIMFGVLVTSLALGAVFVASAQAVWKVGGTTYSGAPLTFSTSGSWTITQNASGVISEFTGCSESGSGTISSPYGVEENLTLSNCTLPKSPKGCVVSPITMKLAGSIGNMHSKETIHIVLNEACNWYESIPLTVTFLPSIGSEGKELSVATAGTASFGGSWTLTGSSKWALSGENTGIAFGTGVPAYSWKQTIGSTGTGNGQFNGLIGQITTDASGNVIVVDHNNYRVQTFNSAGSYVSQFGSRGTADGQFGGPMGIARDSSGNLLVADAAQIEKFTAGGTFLSKFASSGSGDGQVKQPSGIMVDPAGNIWIADTENNRVEEFTSSGKFERIIGSLGSENGQFNAPYGVALSAAGNLLVVDAHNCRVQEFSLFGKYLAKFGSCGFEGGQLSTTAFGITTDPEGNIWVDDSGNRRVEGFNSKGEYLQQFGSSGTSDSQFGASMVGIAVDPSGNLWIGDSGNKRLKKWGF